MTRVRGPLALQMSLANLARFASPRTIPNRNMEIDMITLDKWPSSMMVIGPNNRDEKVAHSVA